MVSDGGESAATSRTKRVSQKARTAPSATGRSYVIDTSVLLSDPHALLRFAEHEVIVPPIVVISELEGKRHDPELGYFARKALRLLDDLRIEHGGLDHAIPPIGKDGGLLRVEMNHISTEVLPAGFRGGGDNDSRILAVAKNLANEGHNVTVVSKDLPPMRVKASAMGLHADEYRNELVKDSGWTGMAEVDATEEEITTLYGHEPAFIPAAAELPVNTGLVLLSNRGSALGRVGADKQVRLVKGDRDVFGLHGRSAEQRLAIDLLMDPPAVGIVSIGGRAGTGKSALALCAGLEAVLERREHRKVVVFRPPLYAVGGQELGYLPPGSESEKMNPGAGSVRHPRGARQPGSRGRSHGPGHARSPAADPHPRALPARRLVIVDEAQSLEKNVLLTVMSRIGQNSKIVLTHDVAQRDNLRVGGRHDGGVAAVVETLKGHPLFGHITLTRSERSPIAALVTELLEGGAEI